MALWVVLLAACSVPNPNESLEGPPSNLTAVAGDARVTLSWSAASGATGYSVRRSTTSGGAYSLIGSASASTSYADTAVTNGTTYYYVVSAFNKNGETSNSTEASATPAVPTVPAAPANLVATAGNASVALTWSASTGATSYRVKRATSAGGPYAQLAAPASTTYTDTAATNGVTYYYVVSAANSLGESANSSQVNATPSPPPPTTFGTWTNVTPAGVDLTSPLSCNSYGTQSVQSDPAHPSNLYAQFNCQGIWKSTDFGATWSGPVNTGANGTVAGDCAGEIAIAPGSTATVPTIYQSCIRGMALGFWRSVDGGVNWNRYTVTPTPARQDYFGPVVDPYDQNHLLMPAHEFDSIVESFDGGQTWSSVPLNNGMLLGSGSAAIFFINTGNATTTRRTWLYLGDAGRAGTWRTVDSGATWVQVNDNIRFGGTQIYQPDNNGVVFMAGTSGVLRSVDYGQTWKQVAGNLRSVVFGTPKNVYAMYGVTVNGTGTSNPAFEVASQPGTGTWVAPGTPAGMNGVSRVAVVNNGSSSIVVGAMWNSGLWRYVEP